MCMFLSTTYPSSCKPATKASRRPMELEAEVDSNKPTRAILACRSCAKQTRGATDKSGPAHNKVRTSLRLITRSPFNTQYYSLRELRGLHDPMRCPAGPRCQVSVTWLRAL